MKKVLVVNVNNTIDRQPLRDAMRYQWKLSKDKLEDIQYVAAEHRGMIIEVMEPVNWMESTKENFPGFMNHDPSRYACSLKVVNNGVRTKYVGMKMEKKYGDASPIHYIDVKR